MFMHSTEEPRTTQSPGELCPGFRRRERTCSAPPISRIPLSITRVGEQLDVKCGQINCRSTMSHVDPKGRTRRAPPVCVTTTWILFETANFG